MFCYFNGFLNDRGSRSSYWLRRLKGITFHILRDIFAEAEVTD
jgi:hypothetical protein